tara:strand:- start:10 stop:525 length:516 start_codon:yes stop_codon:yes gene_type:complete
MRETQTIKYSGLKQTYFDKILLEIINIANLNCIEKKILDFGCGEKRLETLLKRKIFNFDINPQYNEVDNFLEIEFDIIIFNHVLMYMSQEEIKKLFVKIYDKNPKCEFIFGIGKQNIISKLAKNITFNFKAHKGTISSYNQQVDSIKKNMKILKTKKNIFFMTDIFYAKFN